MQKYKVSIIEDDEITSMNLKLSLEKQNYDIVSLFDTVDETLARVETNLPDIFIIDISLRTNNDGIELAKTLKQKYKLPFIFLTSHSTDEIIEEAKLTKPYGYIIKPFHPNSLHATIQMAMFQYIEGKGQESNTNLSIDNVIAKQLTKTTIPFGEGYEYHLLNNELFHYEKKVALKEVETSFIKLLVVKLGLVITHEEATEYILQETSQSVSIRTLVWRLRNKLQEDTIHNAQELGYYIEA